MKILVCGGRDFGASKQKGIEKPIYEVAMKMWLIGALDMLWKLHGPFELVHGACSTGADKLADEWAKIRGVTTHRHPAMWETHGKAAGPIRNGEMLRQHNIDFVVAFPGGDGTKNMIEQAEAAGVTVIKFNGRK